MTILFVDDVAMFRELGALFLARSGRILTASSGIEGLGMVRAHRPDLVISDLQMPDMDGEALCRAIKSDPETSHTPVVLVLRDADPKERARAVKAGADDLLSKPLARLALLETVSRFVGPDVVPGLPRADFEVRVQLSVAGVATQKADVPESWGVARNISRGGIFVQTDFAVAPDQEIRLDFELPESNAPIHSTAQVVWRRERAEGDEGDEPAGLGLRFLELDGGSVRRVDDYVFEHAPSDPANHYAGVAP